MKHNSRSRRRWKKLLWHIHVPALMDNRGVLLPTRHATLAPAIRKDIYFGDDEAKEADIVVQRLSQDDVVMEVGAGIGYLSALCAKRIGNQRVFAYEANPAMMAVIALTHQANGVAPTVKNTLLAEGDGERTFHLADEFWASSLVAPAAGARTITVPQTDLNSELALVRPTFLIVDIEGGEIEFFQVARLDGVQKICLETHPGVLTNAEISGLLARLIGAGFAIDFSLLRKNVFYLYRP